MEPTGFEALRVWQRARALGTAIIPVVRAADSRRDFALSQQLNAAALSLMANIAEGHERQRRREFAQFLRIASGSNAEVRACLYAALDRGHIDQQCCEKLAQETREIARMLQVLGDRVRSHEPR